MNEGSTFMHRIVIYKHPLPRCMDCGAESKVTLSEVTNFGDAAQSFIEVPTMECPNGPHVMGIDQ